MTAADIDDLRDWACKVLQKIGLPPADARLVADNLAFAERRGVSTHGFVRLLTYVKRIQAGGISTTPSVRICADFGALVIIDADHAAGASSGAFSSDLAVSRAQRFGIGCAVSKNSNHFGAAAFFANRIADTGLIGIAACNTDRVMCAPFGGRPVLGTNPLAISVPLPIDHRPQLDMATTKTSQGRVILAAQANEPIPPDWAVDARGRPTTSPAEALRGALLPAAGPKGFGLAFMIDALVAVSGANISPDVGAIDGDPATPQRLGHFFLAMRPDAETGEEAYRRSIERLIAAVHASGVDPGLPPPMVPGEPELRRERDGAHRIELSGRVAEDLHAVAALTGIPVPDHRHQGSAR